MCSSWTHLKLPDNHRNTSLTSLPSGASGKYPVTILCKKNFK